MNSRLTKLSHQGNHALVHPERGFQLLKYEVLVGGKPTQVIYAEPDALEPEDRRYGNPILFPAPSLSCSKNGLHSWEWEGKILPMSSHGFARDLYWIITNQTENSVTAVTSPRGLTKLVFPFEWHLTARYTLDERGLVLDIRVENLGNVAFPYGIGFHPYLLFARSAPPAKVDCSICIPKGNRVISHDKWKTIEFEKPFGPLTIHPTDDRLPETLMMVDSGAKSLELVNKTEGHAVKVSVENSAQSLPVWAIWQDPGTPYVCLEPWSDYPHLLKRQETRKCNPGEKHDYQMVISTRKI